MSTSAATNGSIEDSAVFNKKNLVVLLYLLDGICIFSAAAFVRAFLESRGIQAYVLLLGILCGIQLWLYTVEISLFFFDQTRKNGGAPAEGKEAQETLLDQTRKDGGAPADGKEADE